MSLTSELDGLDKFKKLCRTFGIFWGVMTPSSHQRSLKTIRGITDHYRLVNMRVTKGLSNSDKNYMEIGTNMFVTLIW